MTKTMVLILLAISLSGCASAQSKWRNISFGDSKHDVIEAMGQPAEFSDEGGKDTLTWQMDRFEKCAVTLNPEGNVTAKACKDNPEARAHAQAAAIQAYLQNHRQPSNNQEQSYQPKPYIMKQPRQADCTTNFIGNTAQTNCTERRGIDTSIFE